jgi:transmembrane sensor
VITPFVILLCGGSGVDVLTFNLLRMPLQPVRLRYLLRQYLDGRCTREELEELYTFIATDKGDDLSALLEEEFEETRPGSSAAEVNWDWMFGRIMQTKPVAKERKLNAYWKYAAAAVLLLLLGTALYQFLPVRKAAPVAIPAIARQTNDVAPGADKATLTLADGSTVTLDSTGNQVLQQGSTAIHQQNGALQYQAQGNDGLTAFNTLTTPRGGQFQLTLPDGTKVWLNAASSLTYPVSFTGKQREVTLKGEAYFEVVHNDKMPFLVLADGMEIKDLGTHFNVMAYSDEANVATTLIEGAVAVSDGGKATLLKPGQQAVHYKNKATGIVVQEADIDQAIAWKNGEFYFSHTSIYDIMRQVSRWYDVDVYYQDSPDAYLSGNIRKNVHVSEVFRMLELAGNVKFKIENRKATVMKQY